MAGGMGGGWGKRGSGIPLAERVRLDSESQRSPAVPERAEVLCPGRHCWVSEAVDGHGVKRPGLLVEWRQVAGAWEGRVVYPSLLRPNGAELGGGWVLVEEWLAASSLTPL